MTSLTLEQVRKRILTSYPGLKQCEIAHKLGVTPQYLNNVMNKRQEPGDKILRPLGLRKKISYVRREEE